MKSIRLLPIVLIAVTSLFLLKSVGLLTQGGYLLVGTSPVQAQSEVDPQSQPGGVELTTAESEAAERAAESLFASETPEQAAEPEESELVADAASLDALDTPDADEVAAAAENSEPVTQEPNGSSQSEVVSPTEQAVLQRLRDRRLELNSRENELDVRVALVEAAEMRLNERIASLEALEARVQALVDQRNAQGDEQFAALVSMYENMKSPDAASVFNTLNMNVLLRIAVNMNPRKMSPILADMQTDRAQELTVRMATAEIESSEMEVAANTASQGNGELPQIVGQ